MLNPLGADETLDVLCNEKVLLIQKRKGYRFSMDPFLLANFIRLKRDETLLDVGTGCGIIPIYMAKRGCNNRLVGIEIQDELFDLAVRNRDLNECGKVGLGGYFQTLQHSVFDPRRLGSLGKYLSGYPGIVHCHASGIGDYDLPQSFLFQIWSAGGLIDPLVSRPIV